MSKERIRAVACLLRHSTSGKLLLQQRDEKPLHFPLAWTALGGRVEEGESPEEAAARELMEEIRLPIALELWKVYDNAIRFASGVVVVEQHVFLGTLDRAPHEIDLQEGKEVRYFEREELRGLEIGFGFERLFDEFFDAFPKAAPSCVLP